MAHHMRGVGAEQVGGEPRTVRGHDDEVGMGGFRLLEDLVIWPAERTRV